MAAKKKTAKKAGARHGAKHERMESKSERMREYGKGGKRRG
jgi:hypothetical protein